jgi:hypothetical protein
MAEFSVNASKNIPLNARNSEGCKVICDSAGENCRCPDDTFDEEVGYKGNQISPWNPALIPLQAAGFANVFIEAVFGDGISAPEAPKSKALDPNLEPIPPARQIDNEAYDSFSLTLPPPKGGSIFIFGDFGGDTTPEERGQFAALNMAADFYGGGLPSSRIDTTPNFDLIQSWNNISYTDFSSIGTQLGVE